MAQQTAVSWLIEQIEVFVTLDEELTWDKLFEQAKQMEKEQMKNMWKGGQWSVELGGEFEQYYNKIYGGQGSPDTSPNTQNK